MKLTPLAIKRFENDKTLSTEHDLLNQMTEMVESLGSQKAAALELGISQPYLNDVLLGRRPVSEQLAGKLGWKRAVVFLGADLGREEDETVCAIFEKDNLVAYRIVRTDAEIDDVIRRCQEVEVSGESRFPSLTYEQGVLYGVSWLTEDDDDDPIEG